MFAAMAISTLLVAANILVHYEALRVMSVYVPKLPIAVRFKVLTVVLGCFVAHTVEVWLYAGAFLVIYNVGLGSLKGQVEEHFADFLYFSATSYSTMGSGTSIRPAHSA